MALKTVELLVWRPVAWKVVMKAALKGATPVVNSVVRWAAQSEHHLVGPTGRHLVASMAVQRAEPRAALTVSQKADWTAERWVVHSEQLRAAWSV